MNERMIWVFAEADIARAVYACASPSKHLPARCCHETAGSRRLNTERPWFVRVGSRAVSCQVLSSETSGLYIFVRCRTGGAASSAEWRSVPAESATAIGYLPRTQSVREFASAQDLPQLSVGRLGPRATRGTRPDPRAARAQAADDGGGPLYLAGLAAATLLAGSYVLVVACSLPCERRRGRSLPGLASGGAAAARTYAFSASHSSIQSVYTSMGALKSAYSSHAGVSTVSTEALTAQPQGSVQWMGVWKLSVHTRQDKWPMLRSRSLRNRLKGLVKQVGGVLGGVQRRQHLHFALDGLVVRAEGALEHGGDDLLLARLDLLGGFLPPAHGCVCLAGSPGLLVSSPS
ncbi:hypothetical protein ON010_g2847 [Phytophthora cinnamomi]|nr:hypothetical protein ON010_g2847 [Phytophthora cinnamomi]